MVKNAFRRITKVLVVIFILPVIATILLCFGCYVSAAVVFNIWFVPFVFILFNAKRIDRKLTELWELSDKEMEELGMTPREYRVYKRRQKLEKMRKDYEALNKE